MNVIKFIADSVFIWCIIVVTSTAYSNLWITVASTVAAAVYTVFTYWTGLHKGANL